MTEYAADSTYSADSLLVLVDVMPSGELAKSAAGLLGAAAGVGTPVALVVTEPGAGAAAPVLSAVEERRHERREHDRADDGLERLSALEESQRGGRRDRDRDRDSARPPCALVGAPGSGREGVSAAIHDPSSMRNVRA